MSRFLALINIRRGTDFTNTPSSITENISVRGANSWMMVCSALLASIGLDTNSTAVIIGAMLISPLMSPILGVGFSVGVHDRELFIRSARNLGYATVFSLLASVLYFVLTPLGEITSEILARTKPTLLDIGVAFFGGVAGIISGTRQDKSTAIPGVAIATALMPPLCTAGFGLARGHWEIFAGAFYLFFINAVFIALSTYLIVRMLGFPIKHYVEEIKQKKVARAAISILVLISLPSIWFLYTVYSEAKVKTSIQHDIIDSFHDRGNEILKWEMNREDSVIVIKTFFSGKAIGDEETKFFNNRLREMGLKKYRVRFFRVNLSKDEMDKISGEAMGNMMKMIELQKTRWQDSLAMANSKRDDLAIYKDLNAFYPNLYAIGSAPAYLQGRGKTDTLWTVHLMWDSSMRGEPDARVLTQLERYFKQHFSTDTVAIYSHRLAPASSRR
jgi:uncharacterized hydrophobic protein (TIGR00271 family)